MKVIFGVGIVDVSKSDAGKAYSTWYDMIYRCYSGSEKFPTYSSCSVCDEWLTLSNFVMWHNSNYVDGFSIDKDIISPGNKTYSPDKCRYVPGVVNSMTTRTNMRKSSSLPGASFNSRLGKWQSQCRNPVSSKNEYLGLFDSEDCAHRAWAKRKSEICRDVAIKYRSDIDDETYNALSSRCFLELVN